MKLSVGGASIQTSLFSGTCYMTPLIGAWLADGYWGRYKTIMAFSLIYAAVCFAFVLFKAAQLQMRACTLHLAAQREGASSGHCMGLQTHIHN